MHSPLNTRSYSLCLGLALLGGLSLAAGRPAAAQNLASTVSTSQTLTYTLSNVSFSDGAAATGYFNFNPTTHTFGTYDITTTNGTTDTLTGFKYTSGNSKVSSPFAGTFTFDNSATHNPYNYFTLDSLAVTNQTGTYSLVPGTNVTAQGFIGSGELAPIGSASNSARSLISIFSSEGARGLNAGGSLIVTNSASPVPEASTTVSLGLLLALGLGGLVVAGKRKKVA